MSLTSKPVIGLLDMRATDEVPVDLVTMAITTAHHTPPQSRDANRDRRAGHLAGVDADHPARVRRTRCQHLCHTQHPRSLSHRP